MIGLEKFTPQAGKEIEKSGIEALPKELKPEMENKRTLPREIHAPDMENKRTLPREIHAPDMDAAKQQHSKLENGKDYYDDNGKLYRVENGLVPNSEYEINKYKFTTDDQGRIISAEGTLHMKNREGHLPIKDSIEDIGKGDEKKDDDRGHLIGDQFDGSNGLENMVPQDANINRKDYRNFENELAKEVHAGKKVYVKVEPIYEGDSKRPVTIMVTYSIDEKESVRLFPNGQEG